ncbi:MAG: hypothetical protein JW800_07145, partial [Candidatus Omnitrophica bacterium]|nr:hypothetical protein [Candidatus Omnitrophota bacterium]
MDKQTKKYVLENIKRKSIKKIAQELGIKERKIKKFLQKKDYKDNGSGSQQTTHVSQPPRLFVTLSLILIVVMGFIAFGNSLKGDLLWDDHYLVKNNIYIRSLGYIKDIFTENIEPAYRKRFFFYRPLQVLSYIPDYSIWGLNPIGYHFTNVMLHILVALSVYWLVAVMFRDNILSLITSLLFVVHPLHI